MIDLLVADDHAAVRGALVHMLNAQSDMRVVAEAHTAQQARELVARYRVKVAVVDLEMPGSEGADWVARLCRERPLVRVLVLSMYTDPTLVRQALRAGARGYVAKTSACPVLLHAIREVARGEMFVDPLLRDAPPPAWGQPSMVRLSRREREVLELLCQGVRQSDIAMQLNVSTKTVCTHKTRVMTKLGAKNNMELLRAVMRLQTPLPRATQETAIG
ncbi:MAG: response regulator [Limnohabitans sp.]